MKTTTVNLLQLLKEKKQKESQLASLWNLLMSISVMKGSVLVLVWQKWEYFLSQVFEEKYYSFCMLADPGNQELTTCPGNDHIPRPGTTVLWWQNG